MKPLRDYQARAVSRVVDAGRTARRVCLVAPTGSGKTRMGVEFVARARRANRSVLWICHRQELVAQAVAAIADECGSHVVQEYETGHPCAPVTVSTVQTLVGADVPQPGLVVIDECHHYQADQWGDVIDRWADVPRLGLTATPERSDGRPLAGAFDAMVVAAHYSELIRAGNLVPCSVWVPPIDMETRTLAQSALQAYQERGDGRSGFLFVPTVHEALEQARVFSSSGIPAAAITESTPRIERAAAVRGLGDGTFRILASVYALTEGVDVPSASVCILARGVGHVSPYLQMVGRVLRSHPGKRDALLLDLAGNALSHGSPTEDRDYSLGEGIAQSSRSAGLRQCQACGFCWDSRSRDCPRCGWSEPLDVDSAARMALAGVSLVDLTQALERKAVCKKIYQTLRNQQRETGRALYWVVRRYHEVTGEECVISDATMDEKRTEFARISALGMERGWKPGAASHRYRAVFGVWPKGVKDGE